MLNDKTVKDVLLNIVDNIDKGNSTFSDSEAIKEVLDVVNKATNTQNKLSKYQACKYLNISRATFDNLVKDGKIPKGRKEQGFKELFWYKQDLMDIKNKTRL